MSKVARTHPNGYLSVMFSRSLLESSGTKGGSELLIDDCAELGNHIRQFIHIKLHYEIKHL